jgi:hypothetical protein
MATTFQTNSPEYHSVGDRKNIAWGIALAAVLALAALLMMRVISSEHVPTSATGQDNPIIEKNGASEEKILDAIPPATPTDSPRPSR